MNGEVQRVRTVEPGRALFFVRPRRQVTIRTRLDLEAMRERLAALAAAGEPEGWERFNAHGYFLDGGAVGPSDFILDYRFNNPKNAQVYAVRGVFEETDDWRYVHLDFEAHEPWMGGWESLGTAALIAAVTWLRGLPWTAGIAVLVFTIAIWAWANLLYVPDKCCDRAASWIATELSGSVRVGERWVVPK
jgi:hypothetical protein